MIMLNSITAIEYDCTNITIKDIPSAISGLMGRLPFTVLLIKMDRFIFKILLKHVNCASRRHFPSNFDSFKAKCVGLEEKLYLNTLKVGGSQFGFYPSHMRGQLILYYTFLRATVNS